MAYGTALPGDHLSTREQQQAACGDDIFPSVLFRPDLHGHIAERYLVAQDGRAAGLTITNILDDNGQAFKEGNTTLIDKFVGAGLDMVQCDYPVEMDKHLRSIGKR